MSDESQKMYDQMQEKRKMPLIEQIEELNRKTEPYKKSASLEEAAQLI